MIFTTMLQFSTVSFTFVYVIVLSIFEFDESDYQPYNEYFNELGYNSSNIMLNSCTLVALFLLIVILNGIAVAIYSLKSNFKAYHFGVK